MKTPRLLKSLAPLSNRLLAGAGIALAMLFALGVFSYHNIQRQAEATGWVEHTYQVAGTLQQVLSTMQDADSSQRLFVVSGAPAAADTFEAIVQRLPGELSTVESLVADNPKQINQFSELRRAIDERLANSRQRIAQRRELGAEALNPKYILPNVVTLMEAVRANTNRMIKEENLLLRDRLEQLRVARRLSVTIQAVGGFLSLGLLGLVFAGLVRQIGRANRAEQESQRSNEQLKEANAEMRAFSYSVAHDLRAPLRAINGFAQVLAEDHAPALDADAQRALERITTNASKMDHLIDDLLALSKVSTQSLHTGKVEMNELVRGVYQEIMEQQGGRQIECDILSLPPAVGDPSLLRQVWINLIGNALKFTRGRDKAHIEIGGNIAGPEFATYFIRDNGAGFDMRYVDKLFGAFQRLHRPADFEGTGIGLALVHRIIHRHGGTIWAEGEENKGAVFAFTLPEWNEG